MTDSANQYPIQPNGQDALRFVDQSVTPETSFTHPTHVLYRDDRILTSRYTEPGDGFQLGAISPIPQSGGLSRWSPYCIVTDEAQYFGDRDAFVRQALSGVNEAQGELQPFEPNVLGSGISGRIGQSITLPGAAGPETVQSVEREIGDIAESNILPDELVRGRSPFYIAVQVLNEAEHSSEQQRAQNEYMGKMSLGDEDKRS